MTERMDAELTDAELQREERLQAVRAQTTHHLAWDSRGTDVDGGIAAVGYLAVDRLPRDPAGRRGGAERVRAGQ